MDILFIHGNYPAQFKHLAAGLGAQATNRVIFMTERAIGDCPPIRGVNIINYKVHRKASGETHHYLRTTETGVLTGQAVLRELEKLVQQGFTPKIVFVHGGMGISLFIKELLPQTKIIGLFEWYFTKQTQGWSTGKWDIDTQLAAHIRNLNITQELIDCDAAVAPTQWQKEQFPAELQDKIECIFDGIDTTFFKPNNNIRSRDFCIRGEENTKDLPIKAEATIVTYMTRGMEPLRGFPQFMESVYQLQKINRDVQIIIAGRDRTAYSYEAPGNGGSWKKFMIDKLTDLNLNNLHFTGLLNYEDYVKLLQRTDLHVYFTRPYVISWSLIEASACGSPLLVNKNEATKTTLEDSTKANWVDLDDNPKFIAETMQKGIQQSKKGDERYKNIKTQYELTECLSAWTSLINKILLQ